MTLDTTKTTVEIIESVAKIAALIVGAVWTYMLFIKKRSGYPRATVAHDASLIPLNAERALLRVSITIKNTSEVLLTVASIRVDVKRISPFDGQSPSLGYAGDQQSFEYAWPSIGEAMPHPALEIEPGESDAVHLDFIVEPATASVQIYSYVKNVTKRARAIGWNCTSVHHLVAPAEREAALE